jgi:hypothetical protein
MSYFPALSESVRTGALLLAPLRCFGAGQHSRSFELGSMLTPLGTQQRPELQSNRRWGIKPADLKQSGTML